MVTLAPGTWGHNMLLKWDEAPEQFVDEEAAHILRVLREDQVQINAGDEADAEMQQDNSQINGGDEADAQMQQVGDASDAEMDGLEVGLDEEEEEAGDLIQYNDEMYLFIVETMSKMLHETHRNWLVDAAVLSKLNLEHMMNANIGIPSFQYGQQHLDQVFDIPECPYEKDAVVEFMIRRKQND